MHPIPDFFLKFYESDFFRQTLLITQIVSALLILYFIFSALWYANKSGYMKLRWTIDASELLKFSSSGANKSEKQWQLLKKKMESSSESEWKLAITEAESLLDETLKRAGILGESFGEKIQNIKPDQLKNIADVREVHEIRNQIVHNPDYILKLDEAKRLLEVYEKSLKFLGLF